MYCNKFNCKNQKLPLRSLHFGPWSRLWHSHSQSQSGNLSGKCIGNIYKLQVHIKIACSGVCMCMYMHTYNHVYRNDDGIWWSNDDEEDLCVWPNRINRTVPTQPDCLLRWVALMQLIEDPKRETKNTHSLKGFHVPSTKPRICG